ncbi:hypothetical protein BH11BAC2_BH11BAC2_15460 [soil metagenome]
MKKINPNASLYITCPFCQLNHFLEERFGTEIYFLSSTAMVLNYNESEITSIKDFLRQKNIKNVYLVTDISCNFLEEALTYKKEFGLNCEKELRLLAQKLDSTYERNVPLEIKKGRLAEHNIIQQLGYLNNEKILKSEIDMLGINVQGLITDKVSTLLTVYNNSECL